MKKNLLLLLAAIFISYSPEWLPRFWGSFQEPSNFVFIGSLHKYEERCEADFLNSICGTRYRMPRKLLEPFLNQASPGTLGLGFFLTEPVLGCSSIPDSKANSKVIPLLILDSYKVYKTLDLKQVSCPPGADIIIYAANRKGLGTSGQISGNAAVGSLSYMSAYKRTVEFLSVGIYIVCALSILMTLLARSFLLGHMVAGKDTWLFGWLVPCSFATFALFKSGVLEILFLGPSQVQALFRIQNLASLLAHIGGVLGALALEKKLSPKNTVVAIFVATSLYIGFSFTPIFTPALVVLVLAPSAATLLAAIGFRRFGLSESFSIVAVIECLKASQVRELPTLSSSLILFSFWILWNFLSDIKIAGLLSRANKWNYELTTREFNNDVVFSLLKELMKHSGIGRSSLVVPQSDSSHLLFYCDTVEGLRKTHIETLPVGVGHVLTTGNTLKNLLISSELANNLFQREANPNLGSYFSILPVRGPTGILGTLSLTKYEFDPIRDVDRRLALDVFTDVACQQLASLEWRRRLHSTDILLGTLEKLKHVASMGEESDPRKFLEQISAELRSHFGWDVFFGVHRVDASKLEIVGPNLTSEIAKKFLLEMTWIMSHDNARGPGPLAIFRQKQTIVPQIDWIRDLASTSTKEFLSLSGTKSLAVLPISLAETSGPAFGFLWVSSPKSGEFDGNFERSAFMLRELIENKLRQMVHQNVKRAVLTNHLRKDIYEKIVMGESPVEPGVGTLVMIDLIGSSKISKDLGAESWTRFQDRFVECAISVGDEFCLSGEMFIWDAIYFVDKGDICSDDLDAFHNRLEHELGVLRAAFSISNGPHPLGVRVVAVYGDISREVQNGAWTIVGSAVAEVSKLEQIAKGTGKPVTVAASLENHWASHGERFAKRA